MTSALSASRARTWPTGGGNANTRVSLNAGCRLNAPSRRSLTSLPNIDRKDDVVAGVDVLRVAGARKADVRTGASTSARRMSAAETAETELQAVNTRARVAPARL